MNANESLLLDDSNAIDTMSPSIGNDSMSTAIVTTPSTSALKDRKRRIVVDDDDESPTFNPLRSSKKRGKNSRSRKSLLNRKQRKIQLLSPTAAASMDKVDERAMFTSPEGIVSYDFCIYHYLSFGPLSPSSSSYLTGQMHICLSGVRARAHVCVFVCDSAESQHASS